MTEPFVPFRDALAGRYEVERELGEGGTAIVYLAHDTKHDRRVALKVLRPEIAAGIGTERFVLEIRLAAKLQHPHILPLFDSGEAAGFLYYVAPYVEGESLRDRLRRQQQLAVPEALSIARQVAGALGYAHAHGIVHRDIKPENILLLGGEAIVSDFGIALALTAAAGPRLTAAGMALGTPAYISPEQAGGQALVDARSDIYSLGCVLYEMLAGEPPFSSPTPQAMLARHIHDTPPPLAVLRPTVPPAVAAVVMQALAKAPADRFDTAGDFAAALERAPAASLSRLRRWWGRRPVRVGAAVLGLVAVALAARLIFRRNLFARCTQSFARGEWTQAAQQCHRAALADPGFGPAHLWLAEAAFLGARPDSEWSTHARRAVAHRRSLPTYRDTALADGLVALADSQYAEACGHYGDALARDTMDVLALLGLGECQRRDAGVIRDPGTFTGWRFRSSYWGAFMAYRRALQKALVVNPALGPAAYEGVAKLLLVDQAGIRYGRGVPPDTGMFIAYPALDHDTLLLVAYPWLKAQTLSPPPSREAAVARARSLLQELAGQWVAATPGSGRAHAARARSLEVEGVLGGDGTGERSALAETRAALRLETDSVPRVDLGVAEIRLYLKLLRFHDAARVSDSMLAATPDPGPEAAARLAAVAALLGRAHLAASLYSRAVADTSFHLPGVALTVKAAALRLLAYAALGAPAESISVLAAHVDTLVERWVLPPDRERVRHALLDDAAMLAFPTVRIDAGGPPTVQHFQYQAQWMLANGDTARARRLLDAVGGLDRTSLVPGALLPIQVYHEAYLLLAVRDTADAQWLLDLGLDNLSAAPTFIMQEVQQSASLVRAMALRAQLAGKMEQGATARRWAAAVDTLWSRCDPELQPLVDSLRAL
jgi:tRNA A-37 threonylcarbamoyl transferase component Bud32